MIRSYAQGLATYRLRGLAESQPQPRGKPAIYAIWPNCRVVRHGSDSARGNVRVGQCRVLTVWNATIPPAMERTGRPRPRHAPRRSFARFITATGPPPDPANI